MLKIEMYPSKNAVEGIKMFTSIVPVLLLISIFAPESVRILLIRIPTNHEIKN